MRVKTVSELFNKTFALSLNDSQLNTESIEEVLLGSTRIFVGGCGVSLRTIDDVNDDALKFSVVDDVQFRSKNETCDGGSAGRAW